MFIQLNKIWTVILLLSFIFVSYHSDASSAGNEWSDTQEAVRNFTSSFSIKDTIGNLSPLTIVGLFIAVVVFAIVFRVLILFMIVFGILVMMFGSPAKVMDYFKDKFDFIKNIDLKPKVQELKEDSTEG
ncbi:MAG: hypothetical protein PV340_05290 [Wolbachia sp.]|nr:hypothetical protein [Wolbachia sp.]MDD9336009.1 hypothetical protein [Wolbachia sp.]